MINYLKLISKKSDYIEALQLKVNEKNQKLINLEKADELLNSEKINTEKKLENLEKKDEEVGKKATIILEVILLGFVSLIIVALLTYINLLSLSTIVSIVLFNLLNGAAAFSANKILKKHYQVLRSKNENEIISTNISLENIIKKIQENHLTRDEIRKERNEIIKLINKENADINEIREAIINVLINQSEDILGTNVENLNQSIEEKLHQDDEELTRKRTLNNN